MKKIYQTGIAITSRLLIGLVMTDWAGGQLAAQGAPRRKIPYYSYDPRTLGLTDNLISVGLLDPRSLQGESTGMQENLLNRLPPPIRPSDPVAVELDTVYRGGRVFDVETGKIKEKNKVLYLTVSFKLFSKPSSSDRGIEEKFTFFTENAGEQRNFLAEMRRAEQGKRFIKGHAVYKGTKHGQFAVIDNLFFVSARYRSKDYRPPLRAPYVYIDTGRVFEPSYRKLNRTEAETRFTYYFGAQEKIKTFVGSPASALGFLQRLNLVVQRKSSMCITDEESGRIKECLIISGPYRSCYIGKITYQYAG